MGNKEIANQFNLLGKLMELHGENPFKIRSYTSAYNTLRKYPKELFEADVEELGEIKGVGKAIQAKIIELKETGKISNLEKFISITPPGIIDLLSLKGLGAKKIKQLWKELEIEDAGELLYACKENRLIELKGFGEKTQLNLIDQIEYFLNSKGKFHYASALLMAEKLLQELKNLDPNANYSLTGKMRRKCQIIESVEIIGTTKKEEVHNLLDQEEGDFFYQGIPVRYITSSKKEFAKNLFLTSSTQEYLDFFQFKLDDVKEEQEIYANSKIHLHCPEIRETENLSYLSDWKSEDELIEVEDIKGVVHCHTTYSDGINSIAEMANRAEDLGYDYILITDHSQSAFYANGLKPDRLINQIEEIKKVDAVTKIKILAGIESDILTTGALDYSDDILDQLDMVIGSVHSVLKMDEKKATKRLITAIENPKMHILGHPTGRLLLSRKGYPLDMDKIIDACSANQVAIEINANPYRLDLDWRFIQKAQQKDVLLSINPDAHSISGIEDIKYGVFAARKGMLLKSSTLNSKKTEDFLAWINLK